MQLISRLNKERLKDSLFPILFCVFGILMLIFVRPELRAGIPDYLTLQPINGLISSVYISNGKAAYVEFRLKGINQSFVYPSKANELGLVEDSLGQVMQKVKPINILYDKHGFTSFFSKKESYDVWQIDIEGKSVRSFLDISTAYVADNRFGQTMWRTVAIVFLFMGMLTGRAFWKKYIRRNSY